VKIIRKKKKKTRIGAQSQDPSDNNKQLMIKIVGVEGRGEKQENGQKTTK